MRQSLEDVGNREDGQPPDLQSWLKTMGLKMSGSAPDPPVNTSQATNPSQSSTHLPGSVLPTGQRNVIVVEADPGENVSQGPTSAMRRRTKSVEFSDDIQLVQKPAAAPGDPPKVLFGKKSINNHGLVPLSKYWDKALKDFDTYVPLSVFDPVWLRQDLLEIPIKKKSQKEKSDEYVGLSVPYEWGMTFGQWVVAFDLFLAYLKKYGHDGIIAPLKSHKEVVFAIKQENKNWPCAFRYDMAVRLAVMTIRCEDGSVPDPSTRDEEIEREAIRETTHLGDFSPEFAELNPYSKGGRKEHLSPITGLARARLHPTGNSSHQDSSPRSHDRPIYKGPGSSSRIPEGGRNERPRGGTYRGRNYDPDFQRNRARSPPRRSFEHPKPWEGNGAVGKAPNNGNGDAIGRGK